MSPTDFQHVQSFGGDDSSITSYPDEYGEYGAEFRRKLSAQKRFKTKIKKPLRVEGKIPDIIHVLEYIGRHDNVVATRQSTKAFKNIHDLKGIDDHYCDDKGGEDDVDETVERPIIEIITRVFCRRNTQRPPSRVHRHQSRPITAAFDQCEYRYDGYNSDVDVGEPDFDHGAIDVSEPAMIIHSEHLKNALKAVVSYYPYFNLAGKVLQISAPYRVLYHHRKELADYRRDQPASHSPEYAATTIEHIDVLLNFLDESNGSDIRQEKSRHKLKIPMATYDYFWLHLKPGEIVYAKRYGIWTPYVISNSYGGRGTCQQNDAYKVNAWLLESNGVRVERFMEVLTIAPWLGEQAISSLPVVPAAFWKEDLEAQCGFPMRERSIAEGKLYWDLLKGPAYMQYDGLLVNSWNGSRQASGPTGFMCGRVICDATGFDKFYSQAPDDGPPRVNYNNGRRIVPLPPQKDHLPKTLPRCGCGACADNRAIATHDSHYVGFEDLDPLTDTPPENDVFFLVLSNTIPAFILGNRRWGHLNVGYLKPVKTDKEAFKYLVLDDDIKMTVKALIGRFTGGNNGQVSPWGNDFVKNKGEGRIFLLHGTPGVGKTCTAECIAELTNRPLIALTSGDLSVDSFRVEENLSYFLELGQRYGALVLLDEADVYLERRRSKDISRNGLVSVFLRALEYYRGVLLLTTNRVQSFDTAFLSRIHVALHYKNLRDEDRERIWANNFDRLDRDSEGKIHVSVAAREFVWNSREVRSLKWNGREIRNAMQTALALAESEAEEEEFEKVTIGEKHIRAVVKMSKGFRDYIKGSIPLEGRDYDDLSDGEVTHRV